MNAALDIVIKDNSRMPLFLMASFFLVFSAILVYLSLNPELSLPVLGLVLSIPFIVLIIKYPKFWLWSIAISSFMFFRASDLEISVADVLFGVFDIATIYIWLLWMLLVKREKLVESAVDWMLVLFFIGMASNVIIALLNGEEFINWFREYALFSNILLYFPLRYYLKEKKDIIIILILFAISVLLSAADQLSMYKEIALSQTHYAYQLGLSVRLNQTLFSAAIFFGLLFSLLKMKFIYRLLLWGFVAVSIGALVVSFSRSFWLFVMFSVIYMFFYLSKNHKKILVIALGVIFITSSIAFYSVFSEKAELMVQILSNRILSSSKGAKDISFKLRMVEYEEVFKLISRAPLGGNGLGKKFRFYDPNLHITTKTHNIHNGYFYTIYRLGIPLALFFFGVLFIFMLNGEKLARKLKEPFYKNISLAAMISVLMIMVASLVSNQFFARDGGIVLAVSFAIISINNRKFKEGKIA